MKRVRVKGTSVSASAYTRSREVSNRVNGVKYDVAYAQRERDVEEEIRADFVLHSYLLPILVTSSSVSDACISV